MSAVRSVEWLVSPWDGQIHAFEDKDAVTARAVCTHSAPTGRLELPTFDNLKCPICLITHGLELADEQGRHNEWGAVWNPFDVDGAPSTR
jgi:hypothetical protein